MELYSGLDLHSTNTYIGILNADLKHVFKKRVSNNLDLIVETLEPFKDQLKVYAKHLKNWVQRNKRVTSALVGDPAKNDTIFAMDWCFLLTGTF